MHQLASIEPVDYLVIGHLTCDLTVNGPRLGGTTAYAALTARALGLRVGVVTSWAGDLSLGALRSVPIANYLADQSTTFENIHTPKGRIQYIRSVAPSLDYYHVPEPWRKAAIVHLGPVAQEVEPAMVRQFPDSLVCLTPQGWLRNWNRSGLVTHTEWPEADFMLQRAGAAVISLEDVDGDESRIEEMAVSCRVLAVTESDEGARVFWNGDVRRFRPIQVDEIDPVGAGDIFAAAFFVRLYTTRDPWEAGRFAAHLAAYSVTRSGFAGIPTEEEIETVSVEVL
jgi:hypothetical protein